MKEENWLIDIGVTAPGDEDEGVGAEETMSKEAKARSTSLKFIGNELRRGRLRPRRDMVDIYPTRVL